CVVRVVYPRLACADATRSVYSAINRAPAVTAPSPRKLPRSPVGIVTVASPASPKPPLESSTIVTLPWTPTSPIAVDGASPDPTSDDGNGRSPVWYSAIGTLSPIAARDPSPSPATRSSPSACDTGVMDPPDGSFSVTGLSA